MAGGDTRTFAVMAKVVGGRCNLACTYCYYLEKPALLRGLSSRMTRAVLEAYVRQNLEINGKDATVEFAWHGGEPTLAGLDFFREALLLEKRYGSNRKIVNTLQTNATLLDDEWCRFFSENGFLLGVSLDGPERFHDAYRVGPGGGSFRRTMEGIGLLMRHKVSFNTLTTVNAANSKHPREVYDFLRQFTDFMQFLPVVETSGAPFEIEEGQRFGMPPGSHSSLFGRGMAPFSVEAEDYGDFLCGVFDRWKDLDFGRKFVQIFEATLGNMRGEPGGLCVHEALCGHGASVEANGDVYACDHYAFANYRLGNLLETPLGELMEKNRRFGMHKTCGLPRECFSCPAVRLCFGGCPKDRILRSPDGKEGKNYLCEGYKRFFRHFTENMKP
jgi:uncharacterized protein